MAGQLFQPVEALARPTDVGKPMYAAAKAIGLDWWPQTVSSARMSSQFVSDTDENLLARYHQGDMRAMEELFRRHQKPLFSYVRRVVHSNELAEDVVQEAFIRLCKCRPNQSPEEGKFATWLYTIATNLCRDAFRRSARRPERPNSEIYEDEEAPITSNLWSAEPQSVENQTLQREAQRRVRAAIDALPKRERVAVLLREYQGLAYNEIAEVMGCTTGSVKLLLHRGRRRLRDVLGPLLIDEDEL